MNTKIVMPPRKGWFDPCGEWVGDGYDAEWNAALDEVLQLNATQPQPVDVGELVEVLRDVAWCIDSGPSCQIGVAERCKCAMCVTGRIRAALAKLEGKA